MNELSYYWIPYFSCFVSSSNVECRYAPGVQHEYISSLYASEHEDRNCEGINNLFFFRSFVHTQLHYLYGVECLKNERLTSIVNGILQVNMLASSDYVKEHNHRQSRPNNSMGG